MRVADLPNQTGTESWRLFLPDGWDEEPTKPSEALRAAAKVLEEEGRWIRGDWFSHENPKHEEYTQNPFCNGWGTCAEGAVGLVTMGLSRDERPYYDLDVSAVKMRPAWAPPTVNRLAEHLGSTQATRRGDLYEQALDYALRAINELFRGPDPRGFASSDYVSVFSFNDNRATRDEVVQAFLRGAELAEEYGQ